MIFYDFDFNLLLIEPKVISWRFTKYYNEIGMFEAHLPLSSPATRLVLENDFLVCSVGSEFAVITGKQVENELVLYGRTCNWLLSKRIVLPFEATEKTTGKFVEDLIENAYSSCPDVLFGSEEEGQVRTFAQENPRVLSETVFNALKNDGLGNEFIFDKEHKKWVFNIIKGVDKSLMISEANKNATSTSITVNMDTYANCCYYKADEIYEFTGGEYDGLRRFETFVASGDEEEAKSLMLEHKIENSIEVVATGPRYKKDYLLGDTVRVQIIKNDYKVTKRLRVRGVELISRPGGYMEKPIFEEV